MTGLAARNLHKSFGSTTVLAGAAVDAPAGSVTAVLGAPGSGKTTLVRLVAGFDRPDQGAIRLEGTTLDNGRVHVPPAGRRIGLVPTDGGLFPHLDVEANVGFGLARRGRGRRVEEMLRLVGLRSAADRFPHELTAAQVRRVGVARALALDPVLVVLDDPFAALDARERDATRSDLVAVLRRSGVTTLLATHDRDEAVSLADRVAVLRGGRIVQAGPPEEVYGRPLDAALATATGDANLVGGIARDGSVVTGLGLLDLRDPAPSGTKLVVLLRPEQIDIVERGGVDGRVLACVYHGHDSLVTVDAGRSVSAVPLQVRRPGSQPLRPGAAVSLVARGPVVAWDVRSAGPLPGAGRPGPAAPDPSAAAVGPEPAAPAARPLRPAPPRPPGAPPRPTAGPRPARAGSRGRGS